MTGSDGKKLRVAMAGAGMISWHHLLAWAKCADRATIVAICDPDLEHARKRQGEFAIPAAYSDRDEMLERERIDAVDIVSPRETHVGWIDAAANRGIHAMCQKPLAPSFAEAEAAVSRSHGRIRLMAHENWRFRPWYREIARLLRSGEIGEPQEACMSTLSSGLIADASGDSPALRRQPFMAHEQQLMIAEVLVHHLDVMRALFGPLRVVYANARHASSAVVGESLATIALETTDGVPLIVRGTMAAPGFPKGTHDRLEIVGSRKSLLLDGCDLHVLAETPQLSRFEFDVGYQKSFDDAVSHFVDAMTTDSPFESDGADNLETLRLVDQAYRLIADSSPRTPK